MEKQKKLVNVCSLGHYRNVRSSCFAGWHLKIRSMLVTILTAYADHSARHLHTEMLDHYLAPSQRKVCDAMH